MKISTGDYFIAKSDKKEYLAKALMGSTPSGVEAVVEKLCHIGSQRITLTVANKDLILNLGPTPHPGKVYGLDTSTLFYTKKNHNDFGVVNFFYKANKEVVKALWQAMDKVATILEKRGLSFLLTDIVWEVIPHNGEKYAGMYMKSKNEKLPNRIQIRPECMPTTEYAYVLLHELGHHLHLTYVTSKKINALWLRLFNTSIRVETIKKEVSASLLEGLLSQEDLPSDFKGQLGEEEALAYKWIMRAISAEHNLSIKELDILFEADQKEDIRKLWPLRTIPRKELAPIVTEYATKSYRELFSEAFSLHLTGKKLPEPIVKLLERSMSFAKANKEPQ